MDDKTRATKIWDQYHERVRGAHEYGRGFGDMRDRAFYASPIEMVAVTVDVLIGQVRNGGFRQWWDNGYGKDSSYEDTIASLRILEREVPGSDPNTKRVIAMCETTAELMPGIDRRREPDEDCDEEVAAMGKLDTEFYNAVDEILEATLEAWLGTKGIEA